MNLSNLKAPRGSSEKRKRVGRGQGSGLGKTAGRGGKGQKARSGNMHFEGFEGGQMPLQRRLPKFGFTNPFRKEFAPVNVESLVQFQAGSIVDSEALEKAGLVRGERDGIKILGGGALDRALTVRANRFSQSAKEKIEKAGGKAEVI
ncbi:MAG: 50S ribosomal protein L15 [Deltaproteobacteria bacterium]